MHQIEQNMLFYLMLMIVCLDIILKLSEKVCGHSRKDIPCEITGICTLVHINNNLPDKGPLHFSTSG